MNFEVSMILFLHNMMFTSPSCVSRVLSNDLEAKHKVQNFEPCRGFGPRLKRYDFDTVSCRSDTVWILFLIYFFIINLNSKF